MSNNLGRTLLTENQASPEVSVNDSDGILDAAQTELLSKSGAGGNITMTDTEYRQCTQILATAVTVARDLTLRAIKKFVTVRSEAANTAVVTVKLGSASFPLQPGKTLACYTDGTANGLFAGVINNSSEVPFDIGIWKPTTMSNAETLLYYRPRRPMKLPASLTGSDFVAIAAATASTTVDLKKNGAGIGTLVWAAAGTVPTVTFASEVSFNGTTDSFEIHGPATADATLAGIALNFKGFQ